MIEKTQGIILKTVKYRETSLILDILCEGLGISSFIINGVRTAKKNSKHQVCRIPNIVDIVFYAGGQNKGIKRISDIQFAHLYRDIPFSVHKISMALFMVELTRKCMKHNEGSNDVFLFVKERILHLDLINQHDPSFHILFMIDFAQLLGFGIQNNYSITRPYFNLAEGHFSQQLPNHHITSERDSKLLASFINYDLKIEYNRADRNNLINLLLQFYRFHIDGFNEVRSFQVFKSLYDE